MPRDGDAARLDVAEEEKMPDVSAGWEYLIDSGDVEDLPEDALRVSGPLLT